MQCRCPREKYLAGFAKNNISQMVIARLAENPCRVRRRIAYSTVTLFARLRGWSTSVPFSTAVW